MLHAHTRKKELIDKLSHLGVCITCDRVLSLSAEMGNCVCSFHRDENVVCPPMMRGNVFTTGAVDHNPSSTTAKNSFLQNLHLPFSTSVFREGGSKSKHCFISYARSCFKNNLPFALKLYRCLPCQLQH